MTTYMQLLATRREVRRYEKRQRQREQALAAQRRSYRADVQMELERVRLEMLRYSDVTFAPVQPPTIN